MCTYRSFGLGPMVLDEFGRLNDARDRASAVEETYPMSHWEMVVRVPMSLIH